MNGLLFIDNFLSNSQADLDLLMQTVVWDDRMTLRKTASYGAAYNYSQMSYPFQPMTPQIEQISLNLQLVIEFEPNNCLINYYPDGKSKMGFHSDQTDILETDTGIAIVSLGETRVLRFRKIGNRSKIVDFELKAGSLLYMTQKIQSAWEHAIPKSDVNAARMSLTFRRIRLDNY